MVQKGKALKSMRFLYMLASTLSPFARASLMQASLNSLFLLKRAKEIFSSTLSSSICPKTSMILLFSFSIFKIVPKGSAFKDF